MKRKYIPILVGAILILLLGTAAAAELQTHWLSNMLGNADAHPEIAENMERIGVSNTVDGTTWTIDHVLTEGRVIYWQLTKSRTDGAPVDPLEDGWQADLWLEDADGNNLLSGFSTTMHRIDDGSDPSTCTLLGQAEFEMNAAGRFGNEIAGTTLHLRHVRTRENAEEAERYEDAVETVVELETTIQPFPLRQTVLEDGTGVNVGRLSVELQGTRLLGEDFQSAAQTSDSGCALVLKDGRELPVTFDLHFDTSLPDDAQWQIAALSEIIDPQEAAALRIGDTLYSLKDR